MVLFEIEHCISACLRGCCQTKRRRPDAKHLQRAAHQRQNDRVDADWAGAQHEHGISHRNLAALHRVQGRRQRAAAGHECLRVSVEADAARAWLQINLFGPTTAESIIESVRDPINFAVWTARRGFRDQTVPASVAGAVHVEKRHAIAFAKLSAFDVAQRAANLVQAADRDVTGNQRIGNTLQASLLQINVGAANFRKLDFKQSRIFF